MDRRQFGTPTHSDRWHNLFAFRRNALARVLTGKPMHEDLEATSEGEMFSGGNPRRHDRRRCDWGV